MWAFGMRTEWNVIGERYRRCWSDDFCTFVWRFLEKNSGTVSRLYRTYTHNNTLDFVCRQERLAEDLIAALERAGEIFDPDTIRAFRSKRINESMLDPALRAKCIYTPELRKAVLETEQWALHAFGYGNDLSEFCPKEDTVASVSDL